MYEEPCSRLYYLCKISLYIGRAMGGEPRSCRLTGFTQVVAPLQTGMRASDVITHV